jgi:hypothetical protein
MDCIEPGESKHHGIIFWQKYRVPASSASDGRLSLEGLISALPVLFYRNAILCICIKVQRT